MINFFFILFVFSIVNLFFGNVSLCIGLIFAKIIFIPSIILSSKSSMFSIKVFAWITFICIYSGFYFFYLKFDDYNQFIYFSYEDLDYLEVFAKVGLFLLVVIFFILFYEKYIKKSKFKYSENINISEDINVANNFKNKNSIFFVFLIIFFVATSIPLMNMMIELGIGVTGARPTQLPFKLTGISVHFFKTFLPIFLGVLYLTTKRNSVFMLLILSVFAIYGGAILSSKTIVIATLIIPLFFAIFDKRWLLAFLTLILINIGIELTILVRPYLYLAIDKVIYVNEDFKMMEFFLTQPVNINSINFFNNIFLILDRILSFKAIYRASEIPVSDILSGFDVWLHTLDWNLDQLGFFDKFPTDELHYMTLGYNVATGIYNLSSDIFTKFLWSINSSFLYLILMSLTISILFIVIENTIYNLKNKYHVNERFAKLAIVFFTLSITMHPGYPFLKYMLLIIIFLNLFPKIKQLKELLAFLQISKNDSNKK